MKKYLIIIMIVTSYSSLFSQDSVESDDIFKIGTTPFIYSDSLGIFFSYGINYGSVGMLVGQWILPNHRKNILFREYKFGMSIDNRLHLFLKLSQSHSTWFGYSHLGVDYSQEYNSVGIKWKFYKSTGYYPDYSFKLSYYYKSQNDLEFPFTVSLGSARNKFKYFLSIDIKPFYYFIPIPNRFSLGLSYNILSTLNLFSEVTREPNQGWSYANLTLLRSGLIYKFNNFLSLDLSYVYFDFDFNESIPFSDGLTWENPSNIITVPKKDNYHLLSASINFYLSKALFKQIF